MEKLLELRNLKKHYPILGGVFKREVNSVKALDGIDLDIHRGECVGLVGESGCGKTTTAKTIVRLHAPSEGEINYFPPGSNGGEPIDIANISPRRMKKEGIRSKFQMVFQDPTTSMNPRMLVKNIVTEPITAKESVSSRELESRAKDLLQMVGLNNHHLLRYPHEFSGGQRQRLAVARAIATHPDFLVLDEPTSALDVSVQAQILNLLKELQDRLGLTYLFVTHHLLVVKYISDRLAVMYLGKIVEIANTDALFNNPMHPYTHALLSGIPVPDVEDKPPRIILKGDIPSPIDPPSGCRFQARCPFFQERCATEEPLLEEVSSSHFVACHRKYEVAKLVTEQFGTAYLSSYS